MQKIEQAALTVTLGAVPVIACFLAGWWLSIPFVPESRIFLFALGGLLVGMAVDVVFLRSWVRHPWSLKPWVWKAVYVFYSIGVLGFFMGVPVFNVLLALPAGLFVGRWLAHTSADAARMQKTARQAAGFTTIVLGFVCLASAAVALVNPSTASDLQGMLSLPFEVTPPMIVGLILAGGALILVLQWWLAITSVQRAYRYFVARSQPLGA